MRKFFFWLYALMSAAVVILSFFRQILEIDVLGKIPFMASLRYYVRELPIATKGVIAVVGVVILLALYKNYAKELGEN